MPDGTPPSEFRIWTWGENPTLKGTVVLDKAAADAVLLAYAEHGVELAIDYEHQTFNAEENGKPAPAAGWFRPEVRDDGLWAAGVRWTDEAAGYLKNRQYRYFSPTALLDAKTRKPVRLMPMALTNWPATKDIQPLVARANATSTEINMNSVLVALGLKVEADEAEAFAAVNSLRDFAREVLAISGAKSNPEAIGALTALKAKADRAESLDAELATIKASAAAAEVAHLLDEAVKDGRVAPAKRADLEALHAKHGVDALRTCLSMLPKAAPAAIAPAADKPAADASGLTADQLKILKATGLSPEKFMEHKKVLSQIVNPTEEN
jgi:phage I-like protein